MMWCVNAEKPFYTKHRKSEWEDCGLLFQFGGCKVACFARQELLRRGCPSLPRAIVGGRRWVPPSRFLDLRLFADFMLVFMSHEEQDRQEQTFSFAIVFYETLDAPSHGPSGQKQLQSKSHKKLTPLKTPANNALLPKTVPFLRGTPGLAVPLQIKTVPI